MKPELIGGLLLAFFLSSNAMGQTASAGEIPPILLRGRYGHAAVSLGDEIYVLGGSTTNGIEGSVEKFDPRSGSIELLARNLIPRRYHTAVVHDGRIYILGGVPSHCVSDDSFDVIEAFDPGTGTVEFVTQLPRVRVRPRAVVHDGKLYVMGGSRRQTAWKHVDIYDFETGIWSIGAEKPTPAECGIALMDNRIYAVGGYDWQAGTRAFEVYHIEEDRWEKLPDLPVRISAHSVVAADGRIYVFGDYHQLDRAMVFDFESGTWRMLVLPYEPGRHHDAVLHQDVIWLTGGNVRSSGSHQKTLRRFPVAELKRTESRAITSADEKTPREQLMPSGTRPVPQRPVVQQVLSSEMRAWIEETASKLDRIYSLQVVWENHREHSLMGSLGHPQKLLQLEYERPTGFRFSYHKDGLLCCRDETGYKFSSSTRKRFHELPESDSDGTAAQVLINRLKLPPDLGALLSSDRKAYLEARARQGNWKFLETEEEPFVVVHDAAGIFDRQPPISGKLYFNRETGLVEKLVPDARMETEGEGSDDPASELIGQVSSRLEAKVVALNAPLLDEYELECPSLKPGYTRVENVLEIIGIRSGGASCGPRAVQADDLTGKNAPDFALKLLGGETFKLGDHKGKVIVLDFWATWCGPCVRALPSMRELAETFAEEDVVILGISRDRAGEEKRVEKMLTEHRIEYPNGIDVNDIASKYGVRGIPNVVVLDKQGIVRFRKIGFSSSAGAELEREVRKLLD